MKTIDSAEPTSSLSKPPDYSALPFLSFPAPVSTSRLLPLLVTTDKSELKPSASLTNDLGIEHLRHRSRHPLILELHPTFLEFVLLVILVLPLLGVLGYGLLGGFCERRRRVSEGRMDRSGADNFEGGKGAAEAGRSNCSLIPLDRGSESTAICLLPPHLMDR